MVSTFLEDILYYCVAETQIGGKCDRAAADRLGLAYVRRATGMGALTPFLRAL